ncbi:hypothetical protein ACFQ1S_19905 [Kibdelosporangium lantanae]|uniref:Uncharacterized protein n=1 Tax=Kibdelosporangium lantanae TaxID=1497396 RepID=A0ABW3MDF0_9PSEU
MRHLHSTDIDFLDAFHDTDTAESSPVNAVGVLSRADEVGGGEGDLVPTLPQRLRDRDQRWDQMGLDGQTCQQNTHTFQQISARAGAQRTTG